EPIGRRLGSEPADINSALALDRDHSPAGELLKESAGSETSTLVPSVDATIIERGPRTIHPDGLPGSRTEAFPLQASTFRPQPPDATSFIKEDRPFPPVHLVFTSSADNFMVGRTVSIRQ